jgi:hypothetical protein
MRVHVLPELATAYAPTAERERERARERESGNGTKVFLCGKFQVRPGRIFLTCKSLCCVWLGCVILL